MRRFVIVAVPVLLVAGAVAAAASGWSIEPTPNAASSGGSLLYGVSCASVRACTAVGDDLNGRSYGTLAESWNGSTWSIDATPPTSTARVEATLDAVSCTSARACTAVGDYHKRGYPRVTLAERWDGSTWWVEPTTPPTSTPHSSSSLDGVSCASASACTAVGAYSASGAPSATLAEHWNGTTWSIERTPKPTGAKSSFLDGVSCTSLRACTAVGGYFSPDGRGHALAERWNGTRWSIEPTPEPSGGKSSSLNGVSCTSASACTAVGFDSREALAERWNGTRWSIEPIPNPTRGSESGLGGVSCTSASACTAVGDYSAGTLAERWNGRRWSIEPTPNPSRGPDHERLADSQLNGVSCPSTGACSAVGGSFPSSGSSFTLAERWNGRR